LEPLRGLGVPLSKDWFDLAAHFLGDAVQVIRVRRIAWCATFALALRLYEVAVRE
jgi:hypothetical protein